MATRIYLPWGNTPDVTPSDWEFANQVLTYTYKGVTTPDSSALSNSFVGATGTTSPILRAMVRWVIGPVAAQTISGTLRGQMQGYQSATGANATLAIAAKIIQSDGSDRAVLLAPTASDNITPPPEFGTTLNNRQFNNASEVTDIPITSQDASDGDYLVIEIGFRSQTTTSRNITLRLGCVASSGDLPVETTGTTATTYRPWIEFSDDIQWQSNDQNIDAGTNTVTFSAPTATLSIPHTDFKYVGISSRSTSTTLNYTAQAGNLLIACVKWEGSSGGLGVSTIQEGSGQYFDDIGTLANASTDMHSQVGWLFASAGGTNTYTVTIDGTEAWIEWFLIEFEPPTGCTGVVLDAEDAIGEPSGYPSTSPEIDLTDNGQVGLVIGFCAGYVEGAWEQHYIPLSVAATVLWNSASYYTTGFYRKLDSGTGVEASAYTSQSTLWDAHIVAFKGPTSGGAQNVSAGSNTVTTTNPTAGYSLGDPLIQAGANVVTFSAPTCALNVAINLAAGGVIELDDFNRGDGGLGSEWTALTAGTLLISSQQVVPGAMGTDAAYAKNDFPSALGDQYVEAKIWVTGGGASAYDGPGLVLRGAIPVGNGTYYRVVVNKYSGGVGSIGVGKFIDGAWTALNTLNLGATWVDGDTLKAVITGYVIEVFVNGVSKGTVTDNGQSIATGYPGIGYSSAVTSAAIDDFSSGDSSGAAPTVIITAPNATITQGLSLAAGQNVVTITNPDATVSSGGINVTAGQNTVTITNPDVGLTRQTSVQAGTNTVTVTNPVVSISAVASIAGGQQEITLTAPAANVSSGGVNVTAGINTVTISNFTAVLDIGGNNVQLQAGTNTVTTTAPDSTLSLGGTGIQAGVQTVTFSNFTAGVNIGGTNISAGEQGITVTAPIATLNIQSPGTYLDAGENSVVVTNFTATLSLGNAGIAAGQNLVTFTSPVASMGIAVQVMATTNTVTITNPSTSFALGAVQIQAGQNIVNIEAPPAYLVIPGTGEGEQSPRATRFRLGKRLDWRHK